MCKLGGDLLTRHNNLHKKTISHGKNNYKSIYPYHNLVSDRSIWHLPENKK